jgi:hypothetical protein
MLLGTPAHVGAPAALGSGGARWSARALIRAGRSRRIPARVRGSPPRAPRPARVSSATADRGLPTPAVHGAERMAGATRSSYDRRSTRRSRSGRVPSRIARWTSHGDGGRSRVPRRCGRSRRKSSSIADSSASAVARLTGSGPGPYARVDSQSPNVDGCCWSRSAMRRSHQAGRTCRTWPSCSRACGSLRRSQTLRQHRPSPPPTRATQPTPTRPT